MYRTDDLGRLPTDGSVEYVNQIDSQVKLRAFRIELGEIDIYVSKHPLVRDNVTFIRRDKFEEPTSVTYFVSETKLWFEDLQQSEGAKKIE